MIRRARPLLGTYVEIRCLDGSRTAVSSAYRAIELVQSLLSFHDPDSELSQLNRHAHSRAMRVHPWTYRVLQACQRLHRDSEGRFDPTVAAQLVAGGALPSPGGTPPDAQASFADVALATSLTVAFRRPLWLDLGGIAKGFAVDVAIATLRANGARRATVNAGGDLRVMGPEALPIEVRDPLEPARTFALGALRNGACASSGRYFLTSTTGAKGIVAPRATAARRMTAPVQARCVTVVAPRCMLADALCKVAALQGNAARPLLGRYGAELAWLQ